jgi:hydroxypyruvate reductase
MAGWDTTTEGDRGCDLARRSFARVLEQLDPRALMRARAGEGFPPGAGRTLVVALGKAAAGMLAGWLEAVTPEPGPQLEILLVMPRATPPLPQACAARYGAQLTVFTAGHPEPDGQSVEAGEALLAAAGRLGHADDLLVALISGGGSALAAAPMTGGLAELRRLHRELIASGAPIGDINLIRRYRSRLKGGRLAAAAAPARQQTWILSDMPAEEWRQAASGPTTPDPATAADYAAAVRRWLRREPEAGVEPTPKPGDACFARAAWRKLADNHDACAALARELRAAGRDPVEIDHASDEMEWAAAADYLTDRWRRLRARAPRAALIAGGEVRVRLPENAGAGGRNQQLALAVALALAGSEFTFFSAGTDGVDGNSRAAGACVTGATAGRIRAAGLDAAAHLRRCDATPVLAAAGALVETGPTGNNLRDLRLFL